MIEWLHDRALTLVLLLMFLLFFAGQLVTGFWDHNMELADHGRAPITFAAYLAVGHPWSSTFENWESEFLQMAVFVLLTTILVQKGSPESRRVHAKELVDADPRDHRDDPDAPWPVRKGGWVLRIYENSLGLALVLLFLISWVGHAAAGFSDYNDDLVTHGQPPVSLADFLESPRFWFESFQNWQSEFLSIAAMVWLAVYLRQRYSPESKPVHAAHDVND